jgi:NAD(P)H dehydrogenase (quinone)
VILVTGAGGKTGRAVVNALARWDEPVRALVRREDQIDELRALGARQAISGDLRDVQLMRSAFQGVRAVYAIFPNMSPDEMTMAEDALAAARTAGVEHFVYHSVLHPQVEAMPHHWLKMRVEERLFTSGLNFTILQPAVYMQNVLGYWEAITRQGIYALPYSVEARFSLVDLEDVAEVAARVLREPGHSGAIYELAGPQAISPAEMARLLSRVLARPVEARSIDRREWEARAQSAGMSAYGLETLVKMFAYYDRYGLVGNPSVLAWILGRSPRSFSEFIARVVKGG